MKQQLEDRTLINRDPRNFFQDIADGALQRGESTELSFFPI